MSSNHSLQSLFGSLHRAERILLELRLASSPQPNYVMLLERLGELGQALEWSLQAPDYEHDSNTTNALAPLFNVLISLQKFVLTDLKRTESIARYEDIPPTLTALKESLRTLSTRTLDGLRDRSVDEVVKENCYELKETEDSLKSFQDKLQTLTAEASSKVEAYCKTLGNIFTLLETDRQTSIIFRRALTFLDRIAHEKVASSGLFDEAYYRSQLPEKLRNSNDAVRQYLHQKENFAPFPFFDDRFYRASNKEVNQLRYNPLEHFIRYGIVQRRDPGPLFNTRYYLLNNKDVLDANTQPIRHFVQYGRREGRLPSGPTDGWARRCPQPRLTLAFLGAPDAGVRIIWNRLRTDFETRANGYVSDISPDTWTGCEDGFDVLVVSGSSASSLRSANLRALADGGKFVLYLGDTPLDDLRPLLEQEAIPQERIGAVTTNAAAHLCWQKNRPPIRLHYCGLDTPDHAVSLVHALLFVSERKGCFPLPRDNSWCEMPDGRPCIGVVHPLSGDPAELPTLLEALNSQDLAHPYEVVLLETVSTGGQRKMVEHWLEQRRTRGLLNRFMTVYIQHDAYRCGSGSSRDRGIRSTRADLVFTTDDGVIPGSSCLSEHLWAHRFGDCHAAVGHAHCKTQSNTPFRQQDACDVDHSHVSAALPLADDLGMCPLPNGIFHSSPGTLSFRKDALEDFFFDESLSSSWWENRRMLAKLYFSGKKVRFLEEAISVHLQPPNTSRSNGEALEALRNWNKLLDLFPDLALVDRAFFQWKTGKLLSVVSEMEDAPECRHARSRLDAATRTSVTIRPSKPLRILSFKWHASHQYELFKANHTFTLVTDIGTPHCNRWDYGTRPKPHNIQFAPLEVIEPKDYDFAILPFDEHVLNPSHCAALSPDWGQAFLTMLELTKDMPRAAICHGTPQIHEVDDPQGKHKAGEVLKWSREALRSLLQDVYVVCNSHQARKDWDFANSTTIWHGFSPEEFPDGDHEKDCITLPRKAFVQRPYCRGEAIRQRLTEILGDKYPIEYTTPLPIHSGYKENTQEWASAKFQSYAAYIASFATYFNPTQTSPMPRSRDEAMLAGTIPVTLRNHDVDQFIENGINGFFADSAEEMAEHLFWLKKNVRQRRIISRNARLTAMDVFNIDRYLSEWANLIRRLR